VLFSSNVKKNPHAVALGRLGGEARAQLSKEELSRINKKGAKAGGKARARKLNAAQRKRIAKVAAQARWSKQKRD
jgi:hypothetical protein